MTSRLVKAKRGVERSEFDVRNMTHRRILLAVVELEAFILGLLDVNLRSTQSVSLFQLDCWMEYYVLRYREVQSILV